MQNPDLILIDGSSYLYRAFYVPQLKRMQTKQGEPTGAIFGITNMIKSLMSDYPDSELAAIFDAKGKNFRHEMYTDYKANRPPMPDELRSQVEDVHRVIRALGVPLIIQSGVEADDVIGTYASKAAADGKRILIASGDKDLMQLVSNHVHMIDTMKKVVYDPDKVNEKFGVRPDQIIDYLALMGDTADNVPGVPKVGPKTAVKWLAEYQSIDNIAANADKIGGKVGENLRAALPDLPLSQQLVTLRCDLDTELDYSALQKSEPNEAELVDVFTRLEFRKWLAEMGEDAPVPVANESNFKAGDYQTILSEDAYLDWIEKLAASPGFAIDTETNSLDAQQAELVGLSFCCEQGIAAYVPLAHSYEGAPQQLDREWVLSHLRPLLQNPNIAKIGQNLKYDMAILGRYDAPICGPVFDTMLASYVINSVASRHDMDSLSERWLGHTPVSFSDLAGKGKSQKTFDQIDIKEAGHYAAEDADITFRLHTTMMPELMQNPLLHSVYTEIEMALVPVLARMEANGVLIDDSMLLQQSQQLAASMQQIELRAYDMAEGQFNLASPKQIQEILYDKMNLPVLRKTPKGQPSTAEDVLQELALEHELPKLILEHRSLGKLKSTYTDKLPTMINRHTGRVHTSYHQAVAATGRLSSSDPNLQNIPIRTAEGRKIREAFVADAGNVIVAADYSQIELRIMAHLSQDSALLAAFAKGLDIHQSTAAEIFDCPLTEVTAEQRRHAKAVNFGLIYGMSAFGLAKQIDVARKQAQAYIDQYFDRYPGVRDYMQTTKAFAKENGFVETVYGRRLYLPDINAKNHQRKQYAERTAINAPMQGTAADVIKRAMLEVDQWIQNTAPQVRMIMQVHDELVFELPKTELERVIETVPDIMKNVVQLSVPLEVELDHANNWSAAH